MAKIKISELDALPDNRSTDGIYTVGTDGNTNVKVPLARFAPDESLSTESIKSVQNKVVTEALNGKAPLVSPTFTGIPKAPSAVTSTNNTQIANTAFVQSVVSSVRNTATQAAADATAAKTTANAAAAKADNTIEYLLKAPLQVIQNTSAVVSLEWHMNGEIHTIVGASVTRVNITINPMGDLSTSSANALTCKVIATSLMTMFPVYLTYQGYTAAVNLSGLTPSTLYAVDITFLQLGSEISYVVTINQASKI